MGTRCRIEEIVVFFDKASLQTDLLDEKGRFRTCAACGMYKDIKTPRMPAYGKNKKSVMIIGEAPGENEDEQGRPFVGKTGQYLQNKLKKLGFDLFRDAVCYNACNCRPPENEKPSSHAIGCCRPKVNQVIKEKNPDLIILLGATALESVIGNKWKKGLGGISKWRGFVIPDQELKKWIAPVFHPSYVIRYGEKSYSGYSGHSGSSDDNLADVIWEEDLKNALSYIGKDVPDFSQDYKIINYIEDNSQFKKVIKRILECDLIAFDYETTGLNAYREDQKLICTSVAVSDQEVYVWMNNDYRDNLFRKVLKKSSIGKIAHNLQFEDIYSEQKISEVNNWTWCSMNAAHVLDNRYGINELKFQAYINFGIVGYDDEIDQYLKSKGDEEHNRILLFIKKYGEKAVMKYCALDSLIDNEKLILELDSY